MMIGVLVGGWTIGAFAGGLSISGQGSRALGMGGAFTAVADDGSCIYYNPAGMSQIEGTEVAAGISFIFPEIDYEMPNGVTEKNNKNAYAPTLFITHHLTDKFGIGLGLYSPYARDAVFNDDLANGFPSQKAKMVRTDLSPVVSYQVLEQLSVGAGLIGSYGVINQSIPAGPTLRISDKSEGFGLGGIMGLLWKINKYIQVGSTYRTRVTVQQRGDRTMEQDGTTVTSDSRSDIHYPSSLGLGIAVKPIEKLTLALDGDWYEWSYMKTITTRTDLWPDSTVDLATENSWDFRVGGEYQLPQQWAVRAGYGYLQGAIPNTNILPCKPDANTHEFDVGIGKRIGNWRADLVYEYMFTDEEETSTNIYGYNGKYNITQHMVGFTASYRL